MRAGHGTAAAMPGLGGRLRYKFVLPYRAFLLPKYPVSAEGKDMCAHTVVPLADPHHQ